MIGRPLFPRRWLRLPRQTIRLRLTVLYGALFLVSGAALLTVTYLLVEREYTAKGDQIFVSTRATQIDGHTVVVESGGVSGPPPALGTGLAAKQVKAEAQAHSAAALHQLLIDSGIALAIMAVLSIWLGWLVAGRALRPLRTIASTARDISASNLHRRLALDGPDDEITQLGRTFDDLLERLEASFSAQRQFVANASHELRTPLTLERTLVEVALADPEASVDTLRRMGEQVLAAGEQQERLIEALLTLSRSQRGLDQAEFVDLGATAAVTLDTIACRELALDVQLEPAWTRGDPRLLERLIVNLITNARVHNLPGGTIEVRTTTRADEALVVVENTGPVVPADEVERLFLPFERLESGRAADTNGLGLGLSIVHAVAVAHHATVTASPRPGGGLRIEVAFRAVKPLRRATSRLPALHR